MKDWSEEVSEIVDIEAGFCALGRAGTLVCYFRSTAATLGPIDISIGLGDYTYRELGLPTNADVIRRVGEIARDLGREIATPQEAKQILGLH